jgi:hypothetical protein
MATLIELDRDSKLFRLDPQLEPNEQEWRSIYLSPTLKKWMADDLPALTSTWKVETNPIQQLDALVDEFCSGATLCYGPQFHPIEHVEDGIWQLKTADLRIFGWFHVKDCFVGWRTGLADFIKDHDLYHGFAGETARFRSQLDLDKPKFVPGVNPNDVVSNYSYP